MWLVTEYDEIIPCREWVFASKKEAKDFAESQFDPDLYWIKFKIEKV